VAPVPRTLVLHNPVAEGSGADERDVLDQVDTVRDALLGLGHAVTVQPLGAGLAGLRAAVQFAAPDQVFNLVEAVDGVAAMAFVLPAWLESLDVPFTGAGASALFLTSSKPLAKRWMAAHGLPTPVPLPAMAGTAADAGAWIVKPVWEDASVGIDDCSVLADAAAARHLLAELGGGPDRWFAERFVEGREISVALLAGPGGPVALPPSEILFVDFPPGKPCIVGYAAKWEPGSFEFDHTPRRFPDPAGEAGLLARLSALALRCWHLFGLRGSARVDFRVDARGEPWILEVNANPCLAPDAGFAAALERGGLSLRDAVAAILADVPRAAVRTA
jgi:D-alanine-D-alanine ligase